MKQILCLYVDEELKKFLEKKASEKNKTLSQFIRELIVEKIIEEEYLERKESDPSLSLPQFVKEVLAKKIIEKDTVNK